MSDAQVLAGICGSSTRAVIESPIEYAKETPSDILWRPNVQVVFFSRAFWNNHVCFNMSVAEQKNTSGVPGSFKGLQLAPLVPA